MQNQKERQISPVEPHSITTRKRTRVMTKHYRARVECKRKVEENSRSLSNNGGGGIKRKRLREFMGMKKEDIPRRVNRGIRTRGSSFRISVGGRSQQGK